MLLALDELREEELKLLLLEDELTLLLLEELLEEETLLLLEEELILLLEEELRLLLREDELGLELKPLASKTNPEDGVTGLMVPLLLKDNLSTATCRRYVPPP